MPPTNTPTEIEPASKGKGFSVPKKIRFENATYADGLLRLGVSVLWDTDAKDLTTLSHERVVPNDKIGRGIETLWDGFKEASADGWVDIVELTPIGLALVSVVLSGK